MHDHNVIKWSEGHLPHFNQRRVSEFALCILGMWVVFGGTLVVAGFTDDWSPTAAFWALPSWVELFLGLSIQGGSLVVLTGVLPPHEMASQRWAFEISGFILTSVGWLAFAIAMFVMVPSDVLHCVYGLGFAIASIARVTRVWKVSTHTRGVKKLIDREVEDHDG